jgi:hypothetical protein
MLYDFGVHSRLLGCDILFVGNHETENALVELDPSIEGACLDRYGDMI